MAIGVAGGIVNMQAIPVSRGDERGMKLKKGSPWQAGRSKGRMTRPVGITMEIS
jgi:hypothetical protein